MLHSPFRLPSRLNILFSLCLAAFPVTAHAQLDTNENGMSDIWERHFNDGKLFPPSFLPAEDADGDTFSNRIESIAGTDPTDGKDHPKLSIQYIPEVWFSDPEEEELILLSPQAFEIEFFSVLGKNHQLLYSTNLVDWTEAAWPIYGYGYPESIIQMPEDLNGNPVPKGFWRLEINDLDQDGEGILDAEEWRIGTNPFNSETFDIPDTWVIHYFGTAIGFDPMADQDDDGLPNFEEYFYNTSPNIADSDGDGANDGDEVNQGGDPADAADGGNPPDDLPKEVTFTIGGDYASWRMEIKGLGPRDHRTLIHASPSSGMTKTRSFMLRTNNRYEITLHRTGGVENWYCWEAAVDGLPGTASFETGSGYYTLGGRNEQNLFFTVGNHWLVDNRQGLFTSHLHSYQTNVAGSLKAELIPMELYSDLNNDGEVNGADSALVGKPYQSGASEEEKDKGTEFLFHNDQLSNGLWDVEDGDSDKPVYAEDDDAQEILIRPGITEGEVWLDHPAIAGLSFYKTRKCNPADKVNLSPSSKFSVSPANPFPEKLFIRADGAIAYPQAYPQVEGDLVLKIKLEAEGEEIEAAKMKLTVVKEFGAMKYFHAANDYILENNTELFVHDRVFPGEPGSSDVIIRLCLMREDGTYIYPYELYESAYENWLSTENPGDFSPYIHREAAGITEVMANSPSMTVIINGNQCGFSLGLTSAEAAALGALGEPQITDKCQGRIKEMNKSKSMVSNEHYDPDTNAPGTNMKGSHLAAPDPIPGSSPPLPGGKHIAQYPSGDIVIGAGYAPDFSPPPAPSFLLSEMGGLSTNYSDPKRNDFNNSIVGKAPIGYTGKEIVFVAMGKNGVVGKGKTIEFYHAAVKSGVPEIAGATTPHGTLPPIQMAFLDSGITSCALAHKNPNDSLSLIHKGSKHSGVPYFTNTFLQFKSSKPRP